MDVLNSVAMVVGYVVMGLVSLLLAVVGFMAVYAMWEYLLEYASTVVFRRHSKIIADAKAHAVSITKATKGNGT